MIPAVDPQRERQPGRLLLTRRTFLKQAAAALAYAGCAARNSGAHSAGPNVLFVSIDDLNDWAAPFGGYPDAHTPHLDRIAERGVCFQRAYCAVPACGGSRSSTLTGLSPARTGWYAQENALSYSEDWFRKRHLTLKTLPRAFLERGYRTLGGGKVFHAGFLRTGDGKARDRRIDATAWREPYHFLRFDDVRPNYGEVATATVSKLFGPRYDGDERRIPDRGLADWAAAELRSNKPGPFFLAVGFYRPHLAWYTPRRFFDLYPLESVRVPDHSVEAADLDDLPPYALRLLDQVGDQAAFDGNRDLHAMAIRAYLACISFADECLGRVLDALDASPARDDTLIVVWSDHGWHLGEKLAWRKFKLWERATRVPLVLAGPGVKRGANCHSVVSLLDVYPTLAELCLSDVPGFLDGESFASQLSDPASPRDNAAVMGWRLTGRQEVSFAVRKERWRYIRYPDGGEELYDVEADSGERINLLHPSHGDPGRFAAVRASLARLIPNPSDHADRPDTSQM